MNKYTEMQKKQYELDASNWSIENRDPVVGSFDQHNEWADYNKFLFKDIDYCQDKILLDFGCGPGRNLVKYKYKFKELHGIDIAKNKLNTYFIVMLLILFLLIFIFTCWIFNQMRILNSNPCHPSIDQLNSVTTGLNFLPFIVSLVLSGLFSYLVYNNLEDVKENLFGKDDDGVNNKNDNGNTLNVSNNGNVKMTEKK